MISKSVPISLVIRGCLSLILCSSLTSLSAKERPNVILFAVDDLCDWVGTMGYEQAITPHMDSLARRGILFSNAHTAGIYCAPSRSAIFTGRYATTTGCYTTQVYFREHPQLRPLQANFSEGGYSTFGAGKLFHHPAGFLDRRGWSEFYLRNDAAKSAGWPLDSWGEDTPKPDPFPNSIYNRGREVTGGLFLEWGALPDDREEDMADTRRVNWACEVLKRPHEKPFFLAVGLYAPHFPNYSPKKYFDLYDPEKIVAPICRDDDLEDLPPKIRRNKENRRRLHHDRLVRLGAVEKAIHGYLACVSYADAMLGRLLETLRESPHADNTIVVLWSDHGYHHGEKGHWGKHTLWERTSNVPFIWAGAGVASGKTVDATVSLIDMYPTFVELCGLPRVDGLEGASLAGTLRDPASAKDRDVLLPDDEPESYAIINRNWRYIHYADETEELYDLRSDPHEWKNLASDAAFAPIRRKLRASAPTSFAAPGPARNEMRLVSEGEDFQWVPKKRPPRKRPARRQP